MCHDSPPLAQDPSLLTLCCFFQYHVFKQSSGTVSRSRPCSRPMTASHYPTCLSDGRII